MRAATAARLTWMTALGATATDAATAGIGRATNDIVGLLWWPVGSYRRVRRLGDGAGKES
ncbi:MULTISPECIES: hypothetical protein [unclassified Nocardia]|uniref:hypothetical protein n=1 Tax=unclassified Nocardia TaxID=2637762 RepID=UPI001CE42CB5|nr:MULTISPECIES: hypothetical protein [unclassified Nocardia]